MKTLKSFLSVGLLSALLLQQATFPVLATTSFQDQNLIVNQQAVDVVYALGLMTGDDNGYFNPEHIVTRGEMAVICTKMLYGSDFSVSLFEGETVFTDVPSWAEGYVNAAVAAGITSGYGDGTFGTDDPINTVQCLLMLLKSLGYFAVPSEFGSDWVTSVLIRAGSLDFFHATELSTDSAHDPITRENVASLVFHSITKVPEVSYNHSFEAYFPTGGSMVDNARMV